MAFNEREHNLLVEIANVYAELSPENLSCDGELRGRALLAKRKRLDAKLKDLFKKIGREVDEIECYEALRPTG